MILGTKIFSPRAATWVISIFLLNVHLEAATLLAQGKYDWPVLGGNPSRNSVSQMQGLPVEWDVSTGVNVKWVASLGSISYATPVISGGMVFVGTNNEGMRDPRQKGDRGVLMAFRESDGEFLWQATSEKLSSGQVNDWPEQGICSTPLVEKDRLFYVTSRCEVVCLDTQGFRDQENDGPFQEEELKENSQADVVWVFDMMKEVNSFPHNMTASAPVSYGNLLFTGTSNGRNEEGTLPSPDAPSIIALDKRTGTLVWSDNSAGKNVLHGQWSSPAVGEVDGVIQVVMGQGDGWVRGYEALTGKKLWEFDTNPKEAVWPKDRNNVISTPVMLEDRVYIANGQDPEHGAGPGHFYCIDCTKRGDITVGGRVWHYDKIDRSISTAVVDGGLVYVPDYAGFLHCLDANTGEVKWVHDTFASVWGSPLVVQDLVYLGDEDGDVVVLRAGTKEEVLAEMNMGGPVYGSPAPANGVLFVATYNQLFALQAE